MSNDDADIGFLDEADTVERRIVRIETRLVKYQEANVMQSVELVDAVGELATAMQEIIYLLEDIHGGPPKNAA